MVKKMWNSKVALAAFAVVSILALSLSTVLVRAQNTAQAGQGLEISPPLIEQQVDPGESITVDIRVRNVTNTTVTTTAQVDDFVAAGEDGQPKLLLEEDGEAPEPSPYSLKAWVSGVPDLTIVPQEVKTAKVTINVPADASPGGHYGVVRFTATPANAQGTAVSLSASIGSLILLSVSGDVTQSLGVEEFAAAQNGKTSSFFEQGPINLIERLNNIGNVHVKPQGSVVVKNIFGQDVATLTVNEVGGNILPGSIRKFEQTLEKKLLFGRYTANMQLTYGDNQNLNQSISFWVIPYKLVIVAIAALLLIIFLIRWLLRRYKQRILSNANQNK